MIWTLVALPVHDVGARARSPSRGSRRPSTSAPKTIAESIDAARAPAQGSPTSCWPEYRERLAEAREQADDIMARARKAAETPSAEATERRQGEARGAGRRGEARHRGRDPALAGADPQGGRRPDRARHREGDAQVPHRRRPEAPGRGRPQRGRLLRPPGRRRLDGGDRPRIRARPCSTSPRRRASSTRFSEQLGQFADALDSDRELQVFFFSPYFSSAEKSAGLGGRLRAPSPSWSTSSSC